MTPKSVSALRFQPPETVPNRICTPGFNEFIKMYLDSINKNPISEAESESLATSPG